MTTANITEAWLARIAPDETKNKPAQLAPGLDREKFWDEREPGFGVIVGQRFASFVVQHRVAGRQQLVTIGHYRKPGAGEDHSEPWTVERARKEARRLLGSMSSGVDPVATDRATEATLREAFEDHKKRLTKKVKAGKRSQATVDTIDKTMARKEVAALLDTPIADLSGEMLGELHEQIKRNVKARSTAKNEKGAPVANRVIANISAAWNSLNKTLGGKLGHWNPAKSVDRDELLKGTRTRVADLADWHARVQTMKNPIQRDGLMFALFTGLRNEDVRTVRFENVDEDANTLRLPDPKGGPGAAFAIPLPATCLEILERRKRDNAKDLGRSDDSGEWVFPGVNSDGEIGPIGDLRQQIHAEGKHSRFPAEDVHTLRRTYESIAHEAGISELDTHVLTNHAFGSRNVNQTYISQHIDHLAACQAKIEAALKTALEAKPKRSRAKLKAV